MGHSDDLAGVTLYIADVYKQIIVVMKKQLLASGPRDPDDLNRFLEQLFY